MGVCVSGQYLVVSRFIYCTLITRSLFSDYCQPHHTRKRRVVCCTARARARITYDYNARLSRAFTLVPFALIDDRQPRRVTLVRVT